VVRKTIEEIAAALGVEALGAASLSITGIAEPRAAGPDDLAMAMSPAYAAGLSEGKARAALISPSMDWQALGLEAAIPVPHARLAMAGVTQVMDTGPHMPEGQHALAVVDPSAEVPEGTAIGAFTQIGSGVRIGPGVRIGSHVSIAEGATIGADCVIHPGARIGPRVTIGARCILQMNCVVGGDGFSFVTPEASQVERARASLGQDDGPRPAQSWRRIHSLGSVRLGDDVEVGCNSTIDRGTVSDTTVGRGTKIDNIVHVGHNCQIGTDCLLCGQVGLAGSVKVGDRVVLGGQVGVSDNITIGSDVVAAGSSIILSNVPPGRMIMGYPAMRMQSHVEVYKSLRRLPRLAKTVAALQKAVFNTDKTS
jgi:UDP-3-O-[3-hydroxymyristoyl] glucosamine N-acyltransferase